MSGGAPRCRFGLRLGEELADPGGQRAAYCRGEVWPIVRRMDDRRDEAVAPWDREDSASHNALRLIAQSTNDGIWDWNLETDEVYYSPRWLELVGYLPGELRGHIDTFIELLYPDDRANAERVLNEYRTGLSPTYRNEFRLRHKDGSWRWILTRGILIREPATDRAVRFVGTHTDITDRVREAERLEKMVAERTADLRAARDRAELMAAATTDFLATVSHDMRQPLQAMALLLSTLKAEVSTPSAKRNFLAIERSLGSSMELLDTLLDYIKLNAVFLRPQLTSVSIGDVFEIVKDTLALAATQKGLTFRVLPTGLAARTNRQMLERILRNLVSNAIKYTDHGRILVGCRRCGNRVHLEVWDTGCGIPAEQQQQIFWEFELKEPGRSQSGLGLGLAIVDRLAKLLGHRVEVRSWPGRGSMFSVDMEAASAIVVATSTIPTQPAAEAVLNGKLIAIIDDDAAVTESLERLLMSYGATAVTASHDDDLLRTLAGRRLDAVIADRHLGDGRDGFVALNRLEEKLGALPSLILTGDSDEGDQQRANNAGRRVLRKPVWPEALEAALCFELGRSAEA
jgi:two-component system, sensor histidine kinase